FGYDQDYEGDLDFSRADGQNTLTDLQNMFSYFSPGAAIIGAISLIIIFFGERPAYKNHKVFSFVPAALIAVVAGALLTIMFEKFPGLVVGSDHLVKLPVINDFGDVVAALTQPDFSQWKSAKFWEISVTIAIVASLESLLSVEAADKLDPQKRDSNSSKELV